MEYKQTNKVEVNIHRVLFRVLYHRPAMPTTTTRPLESSDHYKALLTPTQTLSQSRPQTWSRCCSQDKKSKQQRRACPTKGGLALALYVNAKPPSARQKPLYCPPPPSHEQHHDHVHDHDHENVYVVWTMPHSGSKPTNSRICVLAGLCRRAMNIEIVTI